MPKLISMVTEDNKPLCDICIWYDKKTAAITTIVMKGRVKYRVCDTHLQIAKDQGGRLVREPKGDKKK